MTRHNVTTWIMWIGIFVVGGLQALQGSKLGDFTGVVSIIGMIEHAIAGNTE